MAFKCDLCSKGIMVGLQHRHHAGVAGNRWNRRAPKTQKVFKPNLHVAHIMQDGSKVKVKLCTKCLRMVKKQNAPKVESPVVATA